MRTSPFQALRSVWQTDVKSTLTRTSRRPGGATSTSSIASGSPGPHATAAARARQPCSASHDLPCVGSRSSRRRRKRAKTKEEQKLRREKQLQATAPLHLMGFPRVPAPFFTGLLLPLAAAAAMVQSLSLSHPSFGETRWSS